MIEPLKGAPKQDDNGLRYTKAPTMDDAMKKINELIAAVNLLMVPPEPAKEKKPVKGAAE